ncbi:Txe/YoeB family addiction module toxin [Varibaculum cambriense]|uniref:Endoribonuclease YoeB n=1 Tax=Varibaculum cambriense TaxID=184870 RepID=A0AAJ1BAN4_9ACTO|nr:Txe/YoeB family addiction module toxin [Varibaculum cambriense]
MRRILKLIQSIDRNGYKCIGKPEPLRGDLSGYWSVRIDEKNRLVFKIDGEVLRIVQCGTHYGDF